MKNTIYGSGLTFLMALLFLNGCSTIFGRNHDEQMVMFDASVSEVEVVCSGKRVITPGSLPLRQSKDHACIAQKEGYERKAFKIASGISWSGFGHSTATNSAAWGWWTFGIGTGVGWLVDLPSGAMKNIKEDTLYLEMKPLSVAIPGGSAEKAVDTVLGKTMDGPTGPLGVPQGDSMEAAKIKGASQPKGQQRII